jgi:hypothetical protein
MAKRQITLWSCFKKKCGYSGTGSPKKMHLDESASDVESTMTTTTVPPAMIPTSPPASIFPAPGNQSNLDIDSNDECNDSEADADDDDDDASTQS